MLRYVLFLNLLLCPLVICKRKPNKEKTSSASPGDLGGKLVTGLGDDANIDLSSDEEYEDLRAELLAYHTALATLTTSRRSMKTTPCWKLGGICIDHKMCQGHHSISQAAGCRDRQKVCCFSWNNYQVRDMTDKGLSLGMPWSSRGKEFGGLGIIDVPTAETKKKKKSNSKIINNRRDEPFKIENRLNKYPLHQSYERPSVRGREVDLDSPSAENTQAKERKKLNGLIDSNVIIENRANKQLLDQSHENPSVVVILRSKKDT